MGGQDDNDSNDERYRKARQAVDKHVVPGLIKAIEESGQDAVVMTAIALAEVWCETGLSFYLWPLIDFDFDYEWPPAPALAR